MKTYRLTLMQPTLSSDTTQLVTHEAGHQAAQPLATAGVEQRRPDYTAPDLRHDTKLR
jgi:hypothetical protein